MSPAGTNCPGCHNEDSPGHVNDGLGAGRAIPPLEAFAFHLVDLDGDGDVAFMRARFSMTFTPPGATTPVSDSGKILVVLRKQADGAWLRVADAWNSDLSPSK